eukprot:CAMPEP_0179247440 /NCGR_PEP_ID=MMETSP0797-20121207/19612_1 /TAXON_ID=47934 /ORGANISM="Dinophysis acuminata, Strain DAEP01" /LENGTH=669 /DNA_ID=CAMNT_0020955063 /DNA_START=59 /DNA_END=2065 /DNA_ORIENTATION=-
MASDNRRKRPGDGQYDLEEVKKYIEKRLFIARIPNNTTEEELTKVFGEFGPVKECKLVAHRGVAFVGFDTWGAAHHALVATDGRKALSQHAAGHTIITSFAERTGSVGRGGGAHLAKGLDNSRVFVSGLPEDVTDQGLRDLFEPYGRIESTHRLPAKSRKRCAFVNFGLWGEALDAVEALDGTVYPHGKDGSGPLGVVIAEPRDPPAATGGGHREEPRGGHWEEVSDKRRRTDSSGLHSDNLRINNKAEFDRLKVAYLVALDGDASSDVCNELHQSMMALRGSFAPSARSNAGTDCGDSVASVAGRASRGHAPGSSRASSTTGFAGGARSAPVGASPHDPPAHGERRGDDASHGGQGSARICINGLPEECSDDELRALVNQVPFEAPPKQCEILECWVVPRRGTGFVTFASVAAAEEAIEALDERQVSGWEEELRAEWAKPRNTPRNGYGGAPARDASPQRPRGQQNGRGGHDGEQPDDGDVDRSRLFIRQLRPWATTERIREVFEEHGRLEECRVVADKCIAYVRFAHQSDAKKALLALNGTEVQGVSRREGIDTTIRSAKNQKTGSLLVAGQIRHSCGAFLLRTVVVRHGRSAIQFPLAVSAPPKRRFDGGGVRLWSQTAAGVVSRRVKAGHVSRAGSFGIVMDRGMYAECRGTALLRVRGGGCNDR